MPLWQSSRVEEIYKEERDVLEMMKIDECDMKRISTLDNGEKAIAILGD